MRLMWSILLVAGFYANAQEVTKKSSPKLIVGIVIDQMRYDYLTRFNNRFGENGFKKLQGEGYNCKNHHYNYIPTYTGPGHASIFTGTTPQNHGIVSNYWYDKFEKKQVYCAGDSTVTTLGTNSSAERMSPRRMLSTTFADANKLHTQFKGKTIGISIKDRGAILPAGHTADAAYWFRGKDEGAWVSTDYYQKNLPQWVVEYNTKKIPESYLKEWNTLYPIDTYLESGTDTNNYENGFVGKETATFPYDLKALAPENAGYDILKYSPYGNSLVTDFALETLKNESLGVDDITDVLTISYSSTDYAGHNFGANSKEIEDVYLRLDLELAKLLEALNTQVGEGNYSLFLTADHGAVHVPGYLIDNKVPAYYFNEKEFNQKLNDYLFEIYEDEELIENISNQQVYLNYETLEFSEIPAREVAEKIAWFIRQQEHVQYVYTRDQLQGADIGNQLGKYLQNGFHQRLSGDVAYILTPATISYGSKGSQHGSPQSYDTHVPLLFYGKGFQQGSTFKKTEVIDIAPTICALLNIEAPNSSTGDILEFVLLGN